VAVVKVRQKDKIGDAQEIGNKQPSSGDSIPFIGGRGHVVEGSHSSFAKAYSHYRQDTHR
jgi:hypothetical protein